MSAFLREVCVRLGLKGIEVYDHKLGPDYRESVGGVISRAVGPITETLDRVASCLRPGGRMIFMKGPGCDPEVAEAVGSRGDSFRLAADHAYTIPGTTHDRRLVVFERRESEGTRGERTRDCRRARLMRCAGRVQRSHSRRSKARPTRLSSTVGMFLAGRESVSTGEAILSGARIRAEVMARFRDQVLGWLTGPEGPPPPDDIDRMASVRRTALQADRRRWHARRTSPGESAGDCALVGCEAWPAAARSSCRFRILRMSER